MSDTSAGSNDEFTPPAACPPLPAVAAISSLTLPPFRASDYYRLVKQPLRSPPWRQRFNCLCTQLSTYGFHSEEEFTGDCSLLMSAMQCMPKEDGQGDGDEEDDDHSESEDSATNLGLSLPSCLASGMSIRTLSRGRTAPSFARGAIQRWVQRTYANGNSSLSGNNRPDLCVSMRYRDGYLLSLVGEDAIFGRSSKRAREGETLVYALPSRNTRSGAVRTARPYDEEFAKIWQYKFARIQLYLLSAFVTFGCRLGLLRIHDQYARFYVEDKNTVIVESSADFLSDQPSANAAAAAAGDVSAAAFVDNKENSRHVPHRWTNKTSCLKPMVDIIALAYETLLEVELSEPLPLLFGPERDEALPGVPSVTTTTRHGIELYPILQRDRTGQSPLVPEEQSAARFRDIFRGTDWTWDAAEPPPSPLTSELDYPDDDTDDSPDNPDNPDAGDPDDPNDRPDEVNRDESPTNDDPEDHHAAGQPDDPPADGAVSSEGGSRLRHVAAGRPASSLETRDSVHDLRPGRPVVSGPPAGDGPSREAYNAIAASQTTWAETRESLTLGIDKASFLNLASVRADPLMQPDRLSALDRDTETRYECIDTTRSEREPDEDYAVERAALVHFNVRLKLVTPQQMGDRLAEYRSAVRDAQSALRGTVPIAPTPTTSRPSRPSAYTEVALAGDGGHRGLRGCASTTAQNAWSNSLRPAQAS